VIPTTSTDDKLVSKLPGAEFYRQQITIKSNIISAGAEQRPSEKKLISATDAECNTRYNYGCWALLNDV
jgi:hypothetical protein